MNRNSKIKIAIVHDWLITYAGAERVLEQMLSIFPEADLFSIVDYLPANQRQFILNKSVNTSFIQKLPFSKNKYRSYLPLMPIAVEQFDLSKYDLVISSSHAVAKGVITGPDQLHICMCYSPIRYAWDLQHQYLKESGLDKGFKGIFAKWILHKIRMWDIRTSNGVDEFIAISEYIERRIKKVYRRSSTVIYPPVYVDDFIYRDIKDKAEYYLTSSRMVPYKKIDLIVETFTKCFPDKTLIVIGDGPDFKKIKSIAGSNIQLLGYQPFDVLKKHLSSAKAYVFASEEDFGIAPLEAQASGTPVIAYGKGGALETIKGFSVDDVKNKTLSPTGLFFYEQTVESLSDAINQYELERFSINSQACRVNAERFSLDRFKKEFREYMNNSWAEFNKGRNNPRSLL